MSQFDIITNVNAKSNVSPAEKEQLYNHVIWEGTKAAAVAAGVSTVAAAAAHQTLPGFRRVSLPFKVSVVGIGTSKRSGWDLDQVCLRRHILISYPCRPSWFWQLPREHSSL